MNNKDYTGKYGKHFTYLASNYDFRFNVVTGRFEYMKVFEFGKKIKNSEWNIYDDRVRARLLVEMMDIDLELPSNKFDLYVENDEVSLDYDPFEEYFSNIAPWDGKIDYIKQISETVKTDNDKRFYEVFKRFLVGTLDCLLKEDAVNDVCLVFQSGQGKGKTRWMRSLLPKQFQREYLYEGNIDTKNKDHTQYLSQFWFIHLDELETLKSNDISAIKSFITRQRISLRKAFGRYKSNLVRRASFLGSVNEDKFLSDITGNRRWLVFKTSSINYEHQVDVDKLWAQVFHIYQNGFKHWFDIDEIKAINEQNEKFRTTSFEEEILIKHFDFPEFTDNDQLMSTSEVMMQLIELNPLMSSKINNSKLGKALSRYSKCKKRHENVNKYVLSIKGDSDITPF